VLFLPHAKGRVSCVTLPHQEVLLVVSPSTDLLPEFDVHRKCVRNFKLTATNSSIFSSWSSNVTQTTAVLILQFNIEKISSPLNIKINPNWGCENRTVSSLVRCENRTVSSLVRCVNRTVSSLVRCDNRILSSLVRCENRTVSSLVNVRTVLCLV
jgi:hypothetical protein